MGDLVTRKRRVQPKKGLPNPTEESKVILADIGDGHSVIVQAIPGSGKTTFALTVAHKYPDRKVLLITYSSHLKEETRAKAKACNLKNLEVHSFHAFGSKYYRRGCRNDTTLREVLRQSDRCLVPLNYDLLVIDECQDMQRDYFLLILKCIRSGEAKIDTRDVPQMLILGDPMQCIYSSMGADSRFLTMADRLYPATLWQRRKLSLSHRLTRQMAGVVNDLFLSVSGYINSEKEGPPVKFLLGDAYKMVNPVLRQISAWFRLGYTTDDIMIIAPSVKRGKQSPVNMIENALCARNYLCHVNNKDDVPVLKKVAEGKILFANFSQIKGGERACVLVLGLDMSYSKYYSGGNPCQECPESVFVAVTRASRELCIVLDDGLGYLPFFNREEFLRPSDSWIIERVLNQSGPSRLIEPSTGGKVLEKISVTDLVKHQRHDRLMKALSLLEFTGGKYDWEKQKTLTLSAIVQCNKGNSTYYEQVDDLVGLAIPAFCELRRTGDCALMKWIRPVAAQVSGPHRESIARMLAKPEDCKIADIFKLTLVYDAFSGGFQHRLKQVNTFDWLTDEAADELLRRFEQLQAGRELHCEKENSALINDVTLNGRVDAVLSSEILEVKCTTDITDEHKLQLACYAYIYGENYTYRLVNLFTGEYTTLKYNKSALEDAVHIFLRAKLTNHEILSDDTFLDFAEKATVSPTYFG